MREETVTLGGVEYTIRELPLRKNAEWRAQLDASLQQYSELLGKSTRLEITDTANVIAVVREASQMIIHAPDLLMDLFFAYAVDLGPKRETILESAYESEIMEAFGQVLKLAFPFGRAARLLMTLASDGSEKPPTETISKNSSQPPIPAASG